MGTILRSAEAFGATGAVATRGTRRSVVAEGAARVGGIGAAVAGAARHGNSGSAGAAEDGGSENYGGQFAWRSEQARTCRLAADLREPVAIFIGNEGAGLPPEVEHAADARISIPMVGARGIAERGRGGVDRAVRSGAEHTDETD